MVKRFFSGSELLPAEPLILPMSAYSGKNANADDLARSPLSPAR